jgi:hypothetical protein
MRDNQVSYVVTGDQTLQGKWRKAAVRAGMALGAKEEDAVALFLRHLYLYGKAMGKWWLSDHGDGRYEITRLTVAAADFCGYMIEEAKKREKPGRIQ